MKTMRWSTLLVCVAVALPLHADPSATTAPSDPVINTHYNGGFLDNFPDELSLIRTMLPLAQLDMATALGTSSYSKGFEHPVAIRFDDGGPAIAENPFFYLQDSANGAPYAQTLVVNVEAFSKAPGDSSTKSDEIHRALNYAMTQLILNDMAGGDADKVLPEWVQEGTAVYLSGMGPSFVEKTASGVTQSHVDDLMDDLNRPFPIITKREYARYYLAISYIAHVGGSGNFQAFMADMLKTPDAAPAILDALNQDWPTFEKNVRIYSKAAFMKFARPDDNTTTTPTSPYRHSTPQ